MGLKIKILNKGYTAIQIRQVSIVTNSIFPSQNCHGRTFESFVNTFHDKVGYQLILWPAEDTSQVSFLPTCVKIYT